MRREQSGLYLTAGSAPRTAGLRFPWGDMAVAVVLAAGTCLLLRELFPSVTEPMVAADTADAAAVRSASAAV